jgi:hypothetical protein
MTKNEQTAPNLSSRDGVTPAERYLAKLCKRSFLSLWSYSHVFRDQGRTNGKGDGKELCDLLVVFKSHILIFSDKDCAFRDGTDIALEWSRWYRKAIKKSADQVFGAERWIRTFPNSLFLDKECKVPFPIDLPPTNGAIFHRIVVAHDGARKCHEALGGSGSLMLDNSLEADQHLATPFTIGKITPERGFVHVLDDTTLNVIMHQLDTITDFVEYLSKKESLMIGDVHIAAAGEEELLARYLGHLNAKGEHDFMIPRKSDAVYFDQGSWLHFLQSQEHRAQVAANEISYSWDALIEKFLFHAITGTQYTPGGPLREQEESFRIMARENRTRRRMLAESIHEVIGRSVHSESFIDARVIFPSNAGDPYYAFVCVRRGDTMTDGEYRQARQKVLLGYCHTVKLKWPNAQDIIGIATESGLNENRSEDMIYLDGSTWTAEDEVHAKEFYEQFPLLKKARMTRGVAHEYPVDHKGEKRGTIQSRNSLCKCGSGKRFRTCHGRNFYPKKRKI